jgi:hypothetical protein
MYSLRTLSLLPRYPLRAKTSAYKKEKVANGDLNPIKTNPAILKSFALLLLEIFEFLL